MNSTLSSEISHESVSTYPLRLKLSKFLFIFLLLCTLPSLANVSIGENGAVTSRSIIASEVGLEILQDGGNAIDAAVATAFALAVTYPSAGNIGGGGFMVIHLADGSVVTNDFRERAPEEASRDMFLVNGDYSPRLALQSHLSSGVPGSVAGLLASLEKFGSMTRERVLEAAITLAEEGFQLPADIAEQFSQRRTVWQANPSSAKVFLKSDGTVYEPNEIFRQPDLAATLRRISEKGRDGFYKGKTATLIVKQMQSNGGLISVEDLEAYSSVWRKPIVGTFKEFTIYSMPPPSSGGILLVQMLNMLEPIGIGTLGFGTTKTMHAMIEAERRAYADRAEFLGDSDYYPVPISTLISKEYATDRMHDFNTKKASASTSITSGNIDIESEETTHLSVYHVSGMAVSLTTTINAGYGSGIVVDGAGFLLNNEMDDFSAKPGTPNAYGLVGAEANAIAPGKRMLSSMTPTIVKKGDDVLLITGTPGGSTIITTMLQVVLNVIEHGQSIDESVASPRFHHQWLPNSVSYEHGFSTEVLHELKRLGHADLRTRAEIGDVNQIGIVDDQIIAVSDPRSAGGAAAF